MKNNVGSNEIVKIIVKAEKVALFVHVRPDGDTIGSSFAFKLFLESVGKQCDVFSGEKLPDSVSFLKETEKVKSEIDGEYDLAIAIDSADLGRIGKFADYFSKHKNTVNIDHHVSNTRYAKVNYVVEKAANCENIYDIIKSTGKNITTDIAMFLALGILTDTGGLRHRNVTSSTLTALADLVDKAAWDVSQKYVPYAMNNAELTAAEKQNESNIQSVIMSGTARTADVNDIAVNEFGVYINNSSNLPSADYCFVRTSVNPEAPATSRLQEAFVMSTGVSYVRTMSNGTWHNWLQITNT